MLGSLEMPQKRINRRGDLDRMKKTKKGGGRDRETKKEDKKGIEKM